MGYFVSLRFWLHAMQMIANKYKLDVMYDKYKRKL